MFNACVVSKLMCSLGTLCLRQADEQNIDASQARCLRNIYGVPHSMISHMPNADVRRQTRQHRLSIVVLMRQLVVYGRIASQPDQSPLRAAVLTPGSP
eukprot:4454812-Pyramimonas_sp.AAC.1